MAEQQSYLAKIQDWFNKANQVSVPRTAYTASIIDQTYKNPVSQFIDNTVGLPARKMEKITRGALNTAFPQATLLAGGANEIERRGNIADQFADPNAIPVQPRPATYPMSEVSAMDTAAPPPQAPMPPPMSFLERMAAQKRYSPAEAREGQAAVMKAQGYSPLTQAFSAADGSKPANIFYQEQDGKTRYTIPGQKGVGGVPGYAEFQGQRQGGGSFSVISGRTPEEQAAIDERVASINKQIDAQRIEQGKPTLAEEARMNTMANMVDRFASPPATMNPQQMELWKLQQAQIANMMAQQAEQDKAQQANTAAQQKAALEQYRWQREQGTREQQAAQTEYDRGITRKQAQQDFELKRQMYLSPQVDPIRKEKVLMDAVNEYVGEPVTPGEPPVFHGKAFADRYQIDPYNPDQAETGVPYYHEETGDFIVIGPKEEIVPLRPEIVLAWKMAKGT